ncbi:MAG: phosphopantetheine-binding protein, partial [Actinomycetota bacterium]
NNRDLVAEQIESFLISNGSFDGRNRPDRETELFDSGYVDSLGIVRLIDFLETTFSVLLGDEELLDERFPTINGMTCAVERARERDDAVAR